MKKILVLILFLLIITGCQKDNQDFIYDGPEFPEQALDLPFWNRGGGLIEVTLHRCIDGDTTRFYINNESFSVRYFNIDTPETWPRDRQEPWGKPASDYVCYIIKNAETIHLQSDPGDGPFDIYNRLLGWVWVDGELLQYHLVRQGYADVKYLFGASLYTDALLEAEQKAKNENIKIWGEDDPTWDYHYKRPLMIFRKNYLKCLN